MSVVLKKIAGQPPETGVCGLGSLGSTPMNAALQVWV